MIREVDLVSYLPLFMKPYKEPAAALEAENPEFVFVWEAAERVLKNHFISTADEYGIGRFEKLLGIYPEEEDSLESRRARVQSRWVNVLPYTLRILLEKLQIICGDTDFILSHDFEKGYTLTVDTKLEQYGKVKELEHVMETMLPCSIVVISNNAIDADMAGRAYFAGIVEYSEIITIRDE